MLPNRLIFPANPGGGRSPSHDHDGLEARLGNDHATSRPSLLPTKQPRNPRFYETLSCLVFRRIFRRILSLSDRSSSIILRSIIILSNISLVANFFDDCLRRCFRVFDGGGGRYGEKLTNLILSRHPRERLPSRTRIKVKSFRKTGEEFRKFV